MDRSMRRLGHWMKKDHHHHHQSDRPMQRRRRRQPSQLAFAADHSASTLNSILQSSLTLYCLLMLMLGVVVPISDALAKPVEHADYRQIFYIFLHIVGIISIVYMNALISCYQSKDPEVKDQITEMESLRRIPTVTYADLPPDASTEAGATPELEIEVEVTPESLARRGHGRLLKRLRKRMNLTLKPLRRRNRKGHGSNSSNEPKILWSAVGVNLYLRFGAIIFGFGVMVHTGFKIADVLRKRGSEHCVGPWFLPKHIIDLLFITTQTYFLFKHHRVTINIQKPLIRFFLVHLAVTNLCIWVKTVIYEIKAGLTTTVVKKMYKHFTNFTSNNPLFNGGKFVLNTSSLAQFAQFAQYGAGKPVNISSLAQLGSMKSLNGSSDLLAMQFGNATAGSAPCTGHVLDADAPSVKLGPYLYPCAVEYGLICAAICYKFFTNVGDVEAVPYGRKEGPVGPRTTSCHKSHRGLFVGLLITICVLVPMISLLIMQKADDSSHRDVHIMAMLGIECSVLCFTTGMAVMGTVKMIRRLKPFKLERHEAFDVNLLFIGLAGIICYNLFVSISVGACLMDTSGGGVSGSCRWGSERQSTITKLSGLKSLADVVQSVAQTMFVMQSIQRKVTRDLVEKMEKPGRGLATALLIVNLAMWVASVFEFQRDIGQDFLEFYFGQMPWSIIQFIFQPLIIFYRFHSTVCLSEIWVHSYKLPKAHHL